MFDLDLTVNGMDQLGQNLKAFTADIQQNALEKMLLAGAQPIATEMEAQAPREHDIGPRKHEDVHIADSIVIKVEHKPIGSDAEVYVGPSKRVSWKANWIEFGATAHAIFTRMTRSMRKAGDKGKKVLASSSQIFGSHVQHPGISPRPFIRPALDAAGPDAIAAMKTSLAKSIKDATRRVSKSYAPARKPKDFQG
jgi:HK97 gp10 family phage protein